MTALPTKALPLKKSGAMNETKLTAGIGEMAESKPALVILVADFISPNGVRHEYAGGRI